MSAKQLDDVRITLTPKQQYFRESIDKYRHVLYGGAKGGGKSYGLRNIHLFRRLTIPHSKGAIFRKTFPELEANHIRPLFEQFPHLTQFYNSGRRLLTLPNGSTEEFCYAESIKDIGKFQGREIHDLGIEEAGEWTEEMFTRLRGCNRSSVPKIQPRIQLTANPGGIGHAWLKRLFTIAVFLTSFVLQAQVTESDTIRVYYLGGQSNMNGYGYTSELPESLRGVNEQIWIFHGNPVGDDLADGGLGL